MLESLLIQLVSPTTCRSRRTFSAIARRRDISLGKFRDIRNLLTSTTCRQRYLLGYNSGELELTTQRVL
jgi:hypothetical protein